MAVASYQRHVLYTEGQLQILRLIHGMQRPTVSTIFGMVNGRQIDHLFNKGALRQNGDVLILTAQGKWAAEQNVRRVVQYQRREPEMRGTLAADAEDVLGIETEPDEMTMDLCPSNSLSQETFDELKRDCLDYASEQDKMPDAATVQAWAESVMFIKVTRKQAQSIIKAAEKEYER